MVPIVIPQKKREKPGAERESDMPQHRRERGREADAQLRRHANGVSLAAMILATLLGVAVAVALRSRPAAAVAAARARAVHRGAFRRRTSRSSAT